MIQPNKRPHKAKQTRPALSALGYPNRAFGAELARDPGAYVGRDDLQRMLSARLPDQWTALQAAAQDLKRLHEEACDVGPVDTEPAEQRATMAARAIFGAGAACTFQRDPRGLPLFVAWPRMPARFRCPWEPDRGLPIFLPEREDRDE